MMAEMEMTAADLTAEINAESKIFTEPGSDSIRNRAFLFAAIAQHMK